MSDGNHVLVATGTHSPTTAQNNLFWYNIILIAGSFYELLKNGYMSIENCSIIIFDEVHHAVGAHDYAKIIEEYFKPCLAKYKPKVCVHNNFDI